MKHVSEEYELSRLGAVPVKNSGRGRHHKGDGILSVNTDDFLTVDVKEYGKGYRVTPENWAKINTDARTNGTDPCLQLVLGDKEPKTRVVVVSEAIFIELLDAYRRDNQ